MDFNRICYNCMKEKDRADGICPHCGFDNSRYRWQENELAPLTPLDGKYLVGRSLGAGGFGITYIALDINLQITVAIKELYIRRISVRERDSTISVSLIDKECFEENKKRFLQEARVLAMFNEGDNEGIVNVKEYFEENNTAYIVMEYLDGMTLRNKVKEKTFTFEETKKIIEPICHALTKIHQFGVVHLDVSPDNIMVLKDGNAKLLDFGGARSLYTDDDADFICYKIGYAPPEQYMRNGKIGQWTDVYAIAATMYYCMTGKKPVESTKRRAGEVLELPSKLGVKIPSKIETALMTALELEPGRRFQTVEELWNAINIKNQKKGVMVGVTVGIAAIVLSAVLVVTGGIGHTPKEKGKTLESAKTTENTEGAQDEKEDSVSNETDSEAADTEADVRNVGDVISMGLGTYILENAADRNFIVGIDSGFCDNGARLLLKSYEYGNRNRISVTDENQEDGFYNLRASHTNSFIETQDSQEIGTPLAQYEELYDMGTEKWAFVYCGHDDETNMDEVIIRDAAGSVLAPKDGVLADGTEIVLTQENMEDDSQKWYMRWSEKDASEPDVPVYHQGDLVENISGIRSVASLFNTDFRFSVSRDTFFEAPTLILWQNVWDQAQQFEFVPQEESRYKIYPLDQLEGEHKCLEYQPDTNIISLADDSDNENQLFRLVYAGYNTYLIQSYNEAVLGYDLGDDGTPSGRVVLSRPYDAIADGTMETWLLEEIPQN